MDKEKKQETTFPNHVSEIVERLQHRHNRRREILINLPVNELEKFSKRIFESDKNYSLLNPKKHS